MITTKGIRVWTPRGWLFAADLQLGDKVLSFNAERNCCEYDQIYSTTIEYMRFMGLGVSSKSMHQILTPDHPILVWDLKNKVLTRPEIQSRFMGAIATSKHRSLVCHRMFEPHLVTQKEVDIKWSARVAATQANDWRCSVDLWQYVLELSGYEAQIWLDTFFHWNVMLPAKNWMAAVKVKNKEVKDMLFYLAPRAGVGIKWYIFRGRRTAFITTNGNVDVTSPSGWTMDKIDGLVFNVSTKNGNLLVKSSNGTHLTACDYKEDR
jgi:hypothetical protein